jgi:hypothetical protein
MFGVRKCKVFIKYHAFVGALAGSREVNNWTGRSYTFILNHHGMSKNGQLSLSIYIL